MARRLIIHPFGRPVEPDVYRMHASLDRDVESSS